MSDRIFVTGMGSISSLGFNVPDTLQSLLSEKTGFGNIEVLETIHKRELPAFEVKLHDSDLRSRAGVKSGQGFTRTSLLALIAVKEAVQSAGLSQVDLADTGFISSTTSGGIRELEKYYFELTDASREGDFLEFADTGIPSDHTERVADFFSMRKYVATISTACSSSANALMLGAQLIKNGRLDKVICGGSEALSKFTVNGFNSLMILDRNHCRPFDAARKGLNLGEGAAYLVLESERSALKAGRKPLAELKGYGNANDAFHQTASSPDGAGALRSMKLAIEMSGLKTTDVDYINAHGTATENNDLSEGLAIQQLFGNRVPAISSTKPYTGHTLAAAGSIESLFSVLAIQHQVIFPNLNFTTQMPELTFVPKTKLQEKIQVRNTLSNSFGFGGNTSSVLWSAC
jgi:3-oxoacyl-(acyl-carrier-protein) synthase